MLTPGIRWISSMDVHPSGDHLIVGGYDRKLCWFDLELSEKPYKILRCAPSTFCVAFSWLTPCTLSDITLVRFDRYISIPHIRCSRRRLMMAPFKSSMRAYIVISLQILSSYRSRFCVDMTCVMVWACCRSNGFPSNHGWSAQEQIVPLPSGAIDDELYL